MPPVNRRILIEQAVARGETLDWICDTLHVDTALVDQVLAGMAAAAAETIRRLQPHGTHAAWQRHFSSGEEACQPCVAAEQVYQHRRYLARRARAA